MPKTTMTEADQTPPSPFDVLKIPQDSDEAAILEAYAKRANETNDEFEVAATLQGARQLALSLADWQRTMTPGTPNEAPTPADALTAEELTNLLTKEQRIDLGRFRKTPKTVLLAGIRNVVWHRSAWNALVEREHPEVCAGLLELRGAELAMQDDPEQLFYEWESTALAGLCRDHVLARQAAAAALAYLAWFDGSKAAHLTQRLVTDTDAPNRNVPFMATMLSLITTALEQPRILDLSDDCSQETAEIVTRFFDLVRKAPLLTHSIGKERIVEVAADIADHPVTFLTLFFSDTILPMSLDIIRFRPTRNKKLTTYVGQALAHIAVPLVPAGLIDRLDLPAALSFGDRATDGLLRTPSALRRVRNTFLMGVGIGGLAGLIAQIASSSMLWSASLFVGAVAATVAGLLTTRKRLQRAAGITVTSLVAMNNRVPTTSLTTEIAGHRSTLFAHPWLLRPSWNDDAATPAMDAWDRLIGLVARWGPPRAHRQQR
ncbi:MAG: hypothetical protein J7M25_00025 [Deltaproteobacteria bacterium]|nr:hypothetical protein [Deltaproteobacteria bacterium]